MKNLLSLLTVLASLTIANLAQAGIGWTYTECLQHWGLPTRDFGVDNKYYHSHSFAFKFKGYDIQVWFLNGKVSRISYDGSSIDSSASIILDANKQDNGVWVGPQLTDFNGNMSYKEEVDQQEVAYALLDKNTDGSYYLLIFTAEDDKLHKKKQQETAKDL